MTKFRSTILTVCAVIMGAAAAFNFWFAATHLLHGVTSYSDLLYGVMLPLTFVSALVTGAKANGFSWQTCARSLVWAYCVSIVGFLPALFMLPVLWAVIIDVAAGVIFGGILGSMKLNANTSV